MAASPPDATLVAALIPLRQSRVVASFKKRVEASPPTLRDFRPTAQVEPAALSWHETSYPTPKPDWFRLEYSGGWPLYLDEVERYLVPAPPGAFIDASPSATAVRLHHHFAVMEPGQSTPGCPLPETDRFRRFFETEGGPMPLGSGARQWHDLFIINRYGSGKVHVEQGWNELRLQLEQWPRVQAWMEAFMATAPCDMEVAPPQHGHNGLGGGPIGGGAPVPVELQRETPGAVEVSEVLDLANGLSTLPVPPRFLADALLTALDDLQRRYCRSQTALRIANKAGILLDKATPCIEDLVRKHQLIDEVAPRRWRRFACPVAAAAAAGAAATAAAVLPVGTAEVDAFVECVARNEAVLQAALATRRTRLRIGKEQEEIACINLKPVYLGDIPAYSSMPKTISSSKMRAQIEEDAKSWTAQEYEHSPLKPFFEARNPQYGGYILRVRFDVAVDHLVPVCHGGIDHPRNYAFMSHSLNSSFGCRVDEKFCDVSPAVRRKVHDFARQARLAVAPALNEWLRSEAAGSPEATRAGGATKRQRVG